MQMALVAFIGCRDGSTSELLMQAEAFLPMEADSAEARLNLIPVNGLAEEERPLYALLRIATDYLLADSIDGELARCAYDSYACFTMETDTETYCRSTANRLPLSESTVPAHGIRYRHFHPPRLLRLILVGRRCQRNGVSVEMRN